MMLGRLMRLVWLLVVNVAILEIYFLDLLKDCLHISVSYSLAMNLSSHLGTRMMLGRLVRLVRMLRLFVVDIAILEVNLFDRLLTNS